MAINMTKGQRVSLEKPGGGQLTRIRMGLGWDPISTKGMFGRVKVKEVDLDASCLVFDGNGSLIDQVWFKQLQSTCGAIRHTGDNRTGQGDGDDESILVDLTKLPSNATCLVFTVNSFLGQTVRDVTSASCRLVDETNGMEIAKYSLADMGNHTAQVMAKVSRASGKWELTALGLPTSGRTFVDLLPTIRPHVP